MLPVECASRLLLPCALLAPIEVPLVVRVFSLFESVGADVERGKINTSIDNEDRKAVVLCTINNEPRRSAEQKKKNIHWPLQQQESCRRSGGGAQHALNAEAAPA